MEKSLVNCTIERQEWMKPVEEGLQKAVNKTFDNMGQRGAGVKNFLHGTWIGHPLHVILTDVPIGAWTAAIAFDAMGALTGRDDFDTGADAAVGLGLLGAVGSAVTGLTDWKDVDPPARRVGLVHALLNITSTVLFASSYIARRRDARSAGRSLAALGYAVSAAAANLGGKLVYEHKLGVDHTSPGRLPEEFTPVIAESEVPEGVPVRADNHGTPILIVRRGEKVFAIAETCSHLGGPLSEGTLDGDTIQCPWHGSRFSIVDGSVVDGPAVHPQPCLDARIRNGKIEVRRAGCDAPVAIDEHRAAS